MVNDQTAPLVFFLLQSKSEEQYNRAYGQLKKNNRGLDPSQIVVDFDMASIKATQKVFNGVTIKRCFFVFAQANWGNFYEIGLALVYQ